MNKTIVLIIVFVVALTTANSVIAETTGPVTINNPLVGINNLCDLLTSITKAVAGLVGAISVIMIVIAGIIYLTSAGNPEKINKGKTAFFYAIIGMIIALSAFAIVTEIKIVINAAGGGC